MLLPNLYCSENETKTTKIQNETTNTYRILNSIRTSKKVIIQLNNKMNAAKVTLGHLLKRKNYIESEVYTAFLKIQFKKDHRR